MLFKNTGSGRFRVGVRANALQDLDFALRLSAVKPFVYVRSPKTFAFRNHASQSHSRTLADYLAWALQTVEAEKQGEYPKTSQTGFRNRRARIANEARWISSGSLSEGKLLAAVRLYLETIRWNLRERKLRYLAGFPIRALLACLMLGWTQLRPVRTFLIRSNTPFRQNWKF